MSAAHGYTPGSGKANRKVDITDRSTQQDPRIKRNQRTTTGGIKEGKNSTQQKFNLCVQFHKNPDYFWKLEKIAKNRPTGWVTNQKK